MSLYNVLATGALAPWSHGVEIQQGSPCRSKRGAGGQGQILLVVESIGSEDGRL